jgi:glutamate formiminotransferase/formiminotetrahydrofolate cyclodeaminase
MNLSNRTVKAFLDELASGSPAPGGGSTAAMAGALCAALCGMVARLTFGREKLRDSWPAMAEAVAEADRLRARFLCLGG